MDIPQNILGDAFRILRHQEDISYNAMEMRGLSHEEALQVENGNADSQAVEKYMRILEITDPQKAIDQAIVALASYGATTPMAVGKGGHSHQVDFLKLPTVGTMVKRVRESLGITQDVLHQKTGLTINFISRAENGVKEMSIESVRKIVGAFDINEMANPYASLIHLYVENGLHLNAPSKMLH